MMRWGRKATQVEKDTLREEKYFLNTFLKNDALREESDPGRKGHPEGVNVFFKYTSQKWCAEGGTRPRSKRTPWGRNIIS